MNTIDTINDILFEYGKQGYRLTLRQLYYQLVSRGIIANKIQEYSKLSSILVISRMNGLTDWEMIEDRLRTPYIQYYVSGIEGAIKDTIDQYKLDRQHGQKNYIEIWTEKDAVSNVLKRISNKYHVKLVINRGYSSCSAMYDAYNRILEMEAMGKTTKILYVGDHDPSGLDMLRDIEERLNEFGIRNFDLVPVALSMEQINELKPPPNPAKITDPRAKWYIAEYGQKSWELDALKPSILYKIVEKALLKRIDIEKYDTMLMKEISDKDKLSTYLKKLKGDT